MLPLSHASNLAAALGPPGASAESGMIDSLWWLFLAICAAALAITHGFIFYSLLRRRTGDARRASVKVEVFWGAVATIGLVVLFITSQRVWARFLSPVEGDGSERAPQRVLVIGEQFKWSVIEPGPDDRLGGYLVYPEPTDALWPNPHITDAATAAIPPPFDFFGVDGPADLPADRRTAAIDAYIEQVNPLGKVYTDPHGWDDDAEYATALGRSIRLEVGRPAEIFLGSRDVIHDFYIPAMRVKLDAVPGHIGILRFTPTETGTFDLLCAEFCGYGHYTMLGEVIVEGGAPPQSRAPDAPATPSTTPQSPATLGGGGQ